MTGKQWLSVITTGLFLVAAVVLYIIDQTGAAATALAGAFSTAAIPRITEGK